MLKLWQQNKRSKNENHSCFFNLTQSIFYEKTLYNETLTKLQQKRVNASESKLKNVNT